MVWGWDGREEIASWLMILFSEVGRRQTRLGDESNMKWVFLECGFEHADLMKRLKHPIDVI